MALSKILLAAAVVYILHKFVTRISNALHNRRKGKALGCLPVRPTPTRWPRGVDKWFEMMAAAKRREHVQHIATRYDHATTFTHPMLFNNLLGTIEPENIKTVLATSFRDFSLGPQRHRNFQALLGDGIFTLDGHGWETSRSLLRPQFTRDQVSDLDALEVHVQRLLALFPADGEDFDLQPLFFRLTLDSATEFLFGESVDSLLPPGPETGVSEGEASDKKLFGLAFDRSQDYIAWRGRFQRFYWLANSKEFQADCARVHRVCDRFVEKALYPEKRTHSSSGRYIFSEALAEKTRDPLVLRYQMLNVLLAGRDTTAGLLGWTFYLLSRHPKVYKRLREEILATFGTGEDGDNKPTFASLKDVTYLRYVLNEVLRLYPSVPMNGRTAVNDTVLPTGGGPDGKSPVFVPKGQRVDYNVYALHRRTDIYGPDALEFRPERWGEGNTIGRGWEYLPFNGGPRICLGQQYALTEASYTVVRILQKFEKIQCADSAPKVEIQANLTMATKKCLVRFWK